MGVGGGGAGVRLGFPDVCVCMCVCMFSSERACVFAGCMNTTPDALKSSFIFICRYEQVTSELIFLGGGGDCVTMTTVVNSGTFGPGNSAKTIQKRMHKDLVG